MIRATERRCSCSSSGVRLSEEEEGRRVRTKEAKLDKGVPAVVDESNESLDGRSEGQGRRSRLASGSSSREGARVVPGGRSGLQ